MDTRCLSPWNDCWKGLLTFWTYSGAFRMLTIDINKYGQHIFSLTSQLREMKPKYPRFEGCHEMVIILQICKFKKEIQNLNQRKVTFKMNLTASILGSRKLLLQHPVTIFKWHLLCLYVQDWMLSCRSRSKIFGSQQLKQLCTITSILDLQKPAFNY